MPPKIYGYKTLKSISPDSLDMQVKDYLNRGFQPYWSPQQVVDPTTGHVSYIQVMVKYEIN